MALLEDCKSAKAAWDLLKSKYAARCSGRVLEWIRELNKVKFDDSETIEDFIARVLTLKRNLAAAGFKQEEKPVILSLLAGLPGSYNGLKERIMPQLLETPPPTLDKVIDEVIIYQGHANIILPEQGAVPTAYVNVLRCGYCKKPGHTTQACYKLKNKKAQQQQQQGQQSGGAQQQQQQAIAALLAIANGRQQAGEIGYCL
jgi:uncharacterized protein with NAD-binding domain and iron-sulfur cluster